MWVMQGESDRQRELLDVESVAGHLLEEGSVFALLAEHRDRLFPDELLLLEGEGLLVDLDLLVLIDQDSLSLLLLLHFGFSGLDLWVVGGGKKKFKFSLIPPRAERDEIFLFMVFLSLPLISSAWSESDSCSSWMMSAKRSFSSSSS